MRVLVAGWFSFEEGHTTAGDLLAKDVVCSWLATAGHPFDVAVVPPFSGDLDWPSADAGRYSHVVFVCVGSSRVDLQACKLEYSIVSPK